MRHSFLYALPVMLAACGPSVTEATGAQMPAPTPPKAEKTADKTATPAIKEAELAGAWSQTAPDTAIYAAEDGTELVKIRCLPADEEQGTGPVLALQSPVSSGSEATSIGVFTGAGAFSMPASVDTQGGVITGTIGADSGRLSPLMVGQGDLKLKMDNEVYILGNSREVEAVVEACRPAPEPAAETPEDSETDTTETPSSQM